MNNKKEKSVYADLSVKKITAPNKKTNEPKGRKTVGGDLRTKGGK